MADTTDSTAADKSTAKSSDSSTKAASTQAGDASIFQINTAIGIDPAVYDSIQFTKEQLLASSYTDVEKLIIRVMAKKGQLYTRPQVQQLFADFKKKGLF